ncbi:hypothetical protein [Massilia endophytica]|uniref:hypothetical protein n=1 Tax=Massilia endophytica TaxID=2899220 RepID=UPI001E645C02|nr:hypothetical protein [Massilia endophytica]UGQ45410.1 hypothetical protein LSQ66_16655 [Massilia endophytica]
MNKADPYHPTAAEQRAAPAELFLVQLDPQHVVDGVRYDGSYLADEVRTCGTMRETCPVCREGRLQLVLRQKNVRIAHLFCLECTRCFGAFLEDGRPALIE